MTDIYKTVSIYDILEICKDNKEYLEALSKWPPSHTDKKLLEDILSLLGIDTRTYVEHIGTVRDKNNKLVEDSLYWQGLERYDDEWLKYGNPSEEMIDSKRGKMARSVNKDKRSVELWDHVSKIAEVKGKGCFEQ